MAAEISSLSDSQWAGIETMTWGWMKKESSFDSQQKIDFYLSQSVQTGSRAHPASY